MAKILMLFAALVTLVVIAESNSLSNVEELRGDGAEVVLKRTKRAEAPAIIDSVSGLVHGILGRSFKHGARLNRQKLRAERMKNWNQRNQYY